MAQLNIKNEETVRLAQRVSELTGQTLTQAVNLALAEKLERLRENTRNERKGVSDRLLEIGAACAALPTLDDRAPDDILYGEDGLPRLGEG